MKVMYDKTGCKKYMVNPLSMTMYKLYDMVMPQISEYKYKVSIKQKKLILFNIVLDYSYPKFNVISLALKLKK